MQIESIRAIAGLSGFYTDDQQAIKDGARADGFAYAGDPMTAGFDAIRQAGEALLVDLRLSDGTVVRGDCAAVQYSGAGGRDPVFRADRYKPLLEGPVADAFEGRDPRAFGENVARLESLGPDGKPLAPEGKLSESTEEQLHTAIRYGVSQALLAAAARARRTTMTDVLAETLGTQPATEPVPVFGQSGDDRRTNAEKMLLKGVPVLPHGLFNSHSKMGPNGEKLVAYLEWLRERSNELASADYEPRFHIDVYGMIGELFGAPFDNDEVLEYFERLAAATGQIPLQIEGPMDVGTRECQIHAMAELRDGLASAGIDVDIVADEWCNTLEDVRAFVDAGAADVVQIKTPDLGSVHHSGEAVRYCEGTDTRAYLGGTCNETDRSARVCAHVALATDAAQVLAKPGMGFDEGYMIVENEMRRTLARRAANSPETAQHNGVVAND
ncbi:methylaspartate ammonia-lyase [Halobacteria archaeon AArc-curdl1]|uniref:methylaspartate ammonia-lyase n=1 Tax=Natronosalvus hydrolyticus TaxID=2979988 RepID=A0AAP2Z731_9EURY|nr:methylaspartate ammonia-lyase [Halobacteria archaeon AArc-curdl1]